MFWAQFGAIIASLVSPTRFIISHNFDTSPAETQWIVLLFGTCQCFRTPSFPQQRHLPSAATWDRDSLYLVTISLYLGCFNTDCCSNKIRKGFLECLAKSEPNPQNTELSEIQVFQKNQKEAVPRTSLIYNDADTHKVLFIFFRSKSH